VIERLRGTVRVEDVLLAAWLILVEPLLGPASDTPSGPSPVEGLIGLVGLIGLAICIGARSEPGVVSGLSVGGEVAWAVGPLIGAFALVLDETREDLALGDIGPVIALALLTVALLARFRLPALDAVRRRALVTPFILASGGSFGEFLGGLRDVFDLRGLFEGFQRGGIELTLGLFLLAFLLLGVLVFYVMLVFAPRQVAEREGTPGSWALRFLLFLVSLIVGSTWAGVIRG
jgi:hypothetical protein